MSRAAVVVIALILGVAAVPVAGAANAISGEQTCRDINRQGAAAPSGESCFDGSTLRRALVAGLLYLAAGFAALAALVGALAAIRGSRGIFLGLLAVAAIAFFVAAYVAARL